MKIFTKRLTKITVEKTWSTEWPGLRYTVNAHFEKRLFGFIKWNEEFQMAGPFHDKQEAKQFAKRTRKKYKLN